MDNGSSYGGRPPSSRGYRQNAGEVPRSGLRTGTLRSGAGRDTVNLSGVGLNTNVQMAERPVTQQGMAMRVKTAGPGRQVQDASYYVSLLRSKCNELATEIQGFQSEMEQFDSDNAQYVKHERTFEALSKEVGDLERKLADYNLAMDKARHNQDEATIREECENVLAFNLEEKEQVDSIFLQRKSAQETLDDLHARISRMKQLAEHKVNQLSPEDRSQYMDLHRQDNQLTAAIENGKHELHQLAARAEECEDKLRNDRHREVYNGLVERITAMEEEKARLQNEVAILRLDPESAKQRLKDRAKERSERMKDVQATAQREKQELEQAKRRLQDMTEEMNERNEFHQDDEEKYEVLFQRDKEMTEFLNQYEQMKLQELNDQEKSKKMIVRLLQHSSSHLLAEKNLTSADGKRGNRTSTNKSKRGQLEEELEKKQNELDRIIALEPKLHAELQSLKVKIEKLDREINVFNDLDRMREEADLSITKLRGLKDAYAARKDAIKSRIRSISKSQEQRKNVLKENDIAKVLEGLEQKLRHYEQNIFHLEEYIHDKRQETDFKTLKSECEKAVDELNVYHIEAATTGVSLSSQY